MSLGSSGLASTDSKDNPQVRAGQSGPHPAENWKSERIEAPALYIFRSDFFFLVSPDEILLAVACAHHLKYCKDATLQHIQLLLHCKAAPYSLPQPQGWPK